MIDFDNPPAEHTENWFVVWFPPEESKKERKFASEERAREFARRDEISSWAPLLVLRTVQTTERIIPIEPSELDPTPYISERGVRYALGAVIFAPVEFKPRLRYIQDESVYPRLER